FIYHGVARNKPGDVFNLVEIGFLLPPPSFIPGRGRYGTYPYLLFYRVRVGLDLPLPGFLPGGGRFEARLDFLFTWSG
ncbi:MAG: hypothetical protein V5A59_12670, partial [Bacteroidales bacterium]